jgi:peroxiredoxin
VILEVEQALARRREKKKRKMSEIIGLAAIAVFVLGVVWLVFFTSPPPPSGQTTVSYAPDFTLTDVDGNTFRLSDQRGKVVVLVFMRTTCSACIYEESHLRALRSSFGGNVVMAIISVDPSGDTPELLRKHRDENLMGWAAISDTAEVYTQYGVTQTPTLFIIDKNGSVQYSHVGITESTVLINEVQTLA